jgi:hypothetical protein
VIIIGVGIPSFLVVRSVLKKYISPEAVTFVPISVDSGLKLVVASTSASPRGSSLS